MSYGIVRIEKYNFNAVGGIQIHDKRLKEGISHTNKDIDWSRTHLNYDLSNNHDVFFHKQIRKRIESLHLKKSVRKDAIVMVQALVTSDKIFFDGMSREEIAQFFLDSYNWLVERYGAENVISANVHFDERTPHLHFNFVPVTSDGRLSAKSLITRQSLREQQDSFIHNVGMKYGLERGKEGSKEKHLEVAAYKLKTKNKEIQDLEQKKNVLEKKLDFVNTNLQGISEISNIQPKQSLTGVKNVTVQDIEQLKIMAMQLLNVTRELNIIKADYERMRLDNKQSLENEKKIISLEKENKMLKKSIHEYESTIKSDLTLQKMYDEVFCNREKEKQAWLNKFNLPKKGKSLTR